MSSLDDAAIARTFFDLFTLLKFILAPAYSKRYQLNRVVRYVKCRFVVLSEEDPAANRSKLWRVPRVRCVVEAQFKSQETRQDAG